jgi:ubiquinone/menaquinone biosynthesis C-methylase UbiE
MGFSDPKRNVEQLSLSPGMIVADFGAGAGFLAVAAAEAVGEDGKVYVLDVQQELLTKATHLAQEHHLDTLVFVRADLEMPQGSTLPEASVDVVLVSNILFQAEDKQAVLTEAFRILRAGGRLLIVDWQESYDGMGPQPEHIFNEAEARTVAENTGFTFMQEIDAGAYHYGHIYRKVDQNS